MERKMGFNLYGSTDISRCPLCGKSALAKTKAGISVCKEHTTFEFPELKCTCKEAMQLKEGRYGPFCICSRCGIMNLRKALEVNSVNLTQFNQQKREILVDAKNAHLFGLR